MNKNALIIYGPTASGKSNFAIEIAQRLNGMIINADSQQVYKEIPIITAQPDTHDTQKVPHKLYGFLPYNHHFTVQQWLEKAAVEINNTHDNGYLPIIVGGTGLYIKALTDGIISIPHIENNTREQFLAGHNNTPTSKLYEHLLHHDRTYAEQINSNDRQRILRALLVCVELKEKYSTFIQQKNARTFNNIRFFSIYIKPDRNSLYNIINARFLAMLKSGAIEEVQTLMSLYPTSNFTKATGIKEIVSYLRKQITYQEMVEKAQQLTRNYAKRQFTWFNNQMQSDLILASPNYEEGIFDAICNNS